MHLTWIFKGEEFKNHQCRKKTYALDHSKIRIQIWLFPILVCWKTCILEYELKVFISLNLMNGKMCKRCYAVVFMTSFYCLSKSLKLIHVKYFIFTTSFELYHIKILSVGKITTNYEFIAPWLVTNIYVSKIVLKWCTIPKKYYIYKMLYCESKNI